MAKRTKAAQAEYEAELARLREWLKPGDTVYTILDHISASGMSRAIRVVVPMIHAKDGVLNPDSPIENYTAEFLHPNYAVGKVLGLRHWTRNGREQDTLVVSGAGMDMGFSIVYDLGRHLWPDGFPCSGQNCRSNDHSNGDRDRTPGHVIHSDGGYALSQRWL